MSYDYSENVLVQGAAGDLLHDELGWELVYAHNRETLGANGTLGAQTTIRCCSPSTCVRLCSA